MRPSEEPRAVETLIAALTDEDFRVRVEAASALGQLGDVRALQPLLRVLRDPAGGPMLDQIAGLALGSLGPAAVGPLIAALADPAAATLVRAYAARGLGQIGDWQACQALIDVLADRNSHVQDAAAEACGKLGDLRAIDPLLGVLIDTGADPVVRVTVAHSLVQLGDKRVVLPMIDLLMDKNVLVRRNVAYSLGRFGDGRALPALEWAQGHDTDPQVRSAAARASEQIARHKGPSPAVGTRRGP